MEPIPIGTTVIRISDGDRYKVIGAGPAGKDLFQSWELREMEEMGKDAQEILAREYPDGVAYEILPAGMPLKAGIIRDYAVYRVRRKSLIVTEEEDG
jgi:hypothetical protein